MTRCTRWVGVWLTVVGLGMMGGGAAAGGRTPADPTYGPTPLPAELLPWAPWVLSRHPDLRCVEVGGSTECLWPGWLDLSVQPRGGSFVLEVHTDRTLAVPLPGDSRLWPERVTLDGKPSPLHPQAEFPFLTVGPGEHRITGSFTWPELPPSLTVPPRTARIRLSVNGAEVAFPEVSEGRVRLGGGGASSASVTESLELEVSRRIDDGVPIKITTQVTLRASGRGREVDLGPALLPGTRPISITANLPARFTPEGHLRVQVRPGTASLTFEALHQGPATRLQSPGLPPPWPSTESWAVATNDTVRAVTLSGAPAVDPARTSLPQEWRSLAAFLLEGNGALQFTELRRGEPEPAPDALQVNRELWLDIDGGGLTLRDSLTGTMNQGWRLDAMPPMVLGHASISGEDQVLTQGGKEGTAGVEVRRRQVDLQAESRVEGGSLSLPAVGWTVDAQSLAATLHLPPGWLLLGATGIDTVSDAWIDRFTLLDLFFVVLMTLAAGRLFGGKWAVVTFLGLALSRHEAGAPTWTWIFLFLAVALLRVKVDQPGRLTLVRYTHVLLSLLLVILLVPFSTDQVRAGLFPILGGGQVSSSSFTLGAVQEMEPMQENVKGPMGGAAEGMDGAASPTPAAPPPPPVAPPAEDYGRGEGGARKGLMDIKEEYSKDKSGKVAHGWATSDSLSLPLSRKMASRQDQSAVVQTGPGVPTWSFRTHRLQWSGPVTWQHTLRLFILPPLATGVLALARVLLLLALLMKMAGWKGALRPPARPGVKAVLLAAISTLALAPRLGSAQPSDSVLNELEKRLLQPPPCGEDCLAVPSLSVRAAGDRLYISAQVDAAAASAWPVPGPASTWVPASVKVDGKASWALLRGEDGLLRLRLAPGVHQVQVEGPLPPSDAITLQFGVQPRRVAFSGEGFSLDGLHPDGTAEGSVQLTRLVKSSEEVGGGGSLTPWLEVHRELDLGIPWMVHTEVKRVGPGDAPVAVKVPLLTGETLNAEDLRVEDGQVLVTLARGGDAVRWDSTLADAPILTLKAGEGLLQERWTLDCSPIFQCRQKEGIAPLRHVDEGGVWRPTWSPWPGEVVTLTVTRPQGVAGQTVTIDSARARYTPGSRLLEGELTLSLRSSRGGQQNLSLPPEAAIRGVEIDGTSRPIKATAGKVAIPLQPGQHTVVVRWQEPRGAGVLDTMPKVDLGGPAVNVEVEVTASPSRFIWWLSGPAWGPVPLYGIWILLVGLAAFLLGRSARSHLSTGQWFLLGIGMTQIPPPAQAIVVGWFLVIHDRQSRSIGNAGLFNLYQLFLVGWTLIAAGCLYAAIHAGLLVSPDMMIEGNGSSETSLRWYQDRVASSLPTPRIGSLPMGAWRVAMLLWSLWLAFRLVRWLPQAFAAFSAGGRWRSMRREPAVAPPSTGERAPEEEVPLNPPQG